jgi:hypothetical protein
MYFRGTLTIDPSQLTKMQKVSPSHGFRKLLFNLTGGQFADKLELETFKAINVLQQVHGSFSAIGINNIIRLTHDDIDIFHDKMGKKNDLDFAMDKYQIQIDESMSTHFNTLEMVLEHEDETFKYLIEITINRSHKQGEYPIHMVLTGMLSEFGLKPGQSREALKDIMAKHFSDQESYDLFITTKKLAFEQFLESIRFETMKHIKVDDIRMEVRSRMVMQKKQQRQLPTKEIDPEYEGTPYGYFGFGDLMLYAWLWSELSYDHNIHLSDVDLVTESGDFVSGVGDEGIDAGESIIMDYNEDFEIRMDSFESGDMGADDLGEMDLGDGETGTSWFDAAFGDSDFDMDFGDW